MIEIGKCYKVISTENIYIFKIKDFSIKILTKWNKNNEEYKYYYINTEIGFSIENDFGVKRIHYTLMNRIDTKFIEIEEKDMDKLVHYYKIMEQSFNSVINKYK